MTFFQVLPWILMVLVVTQMWLAGNKRVEAWYIGLGSQVVWLVFDYHNQAWGLMPLALILGYVYTRNILRWKRES